MANGKKSIDRFSPLVDVESHIGTPQNRTENLTNMNTLFIMNAWFKMIYPPSIQANFWLKY